MYNISPKFSDVLVSAGMELIFFSVAGVFWILCVKNVDKNILMIRVVVNETKDTVWLSKSR